MARPPKSTSSGTRRDAVRVRADGRSLSSQRWLTRQLNDPYVVEAKRQGYRSRAAFKLIEMDDRFRFLKPGARVVDLGAAPGGWSQVARARVRAGGPGGGTVVALDIAEMEPIADVIVLHADFNDANAPELLRRAMNGPADIVLSDMAAPTTGHARTDHLRIMALAETAFAFAGEVLTPGGTFIAKLFQGGGEKTLLDALKRDFRTVRHVKPPASRADSAELYIVATGFRGSAEANRASEAPTV